jgi:hypothetical protein
VYLEPLEPDDSGSSEVDIYGSPVVPVVHQVELGMSIIFLIILKVWFCLLFSCEFSIRMSYSMEYHSDY